MGPGGLQSAANSLNGNQNLPGTGTPVIARFAQKIWLMPKWKDTLSLRK